MHALRNTVYYSLKRFIPAPLRLEIRGRLARRTLPAVTDRWPICPGSERPPKGWPGWPNGKEFGVVLTHDVESQRGLDQVRKLAELEMEVGYRSSFNFVPEGDYRVPLSLLTWLAERGFEVGVHDLHHDGKLYESRRAFARKAERINHYLKGWGAVGFRSGFMLNNLSWLHDLEIEYDASTFDTDPFEPQPEGRHTIFPLWIGNAHFPGRGKSGYVELPYTLPQDSTLFRLLREEGPQTWINKLEWIVRHGGMALLDTHPDYMSFDEVPSMDLFPASYYRSFLEHIRDAHGERHWHALPREVARYAAQPLKEASRSQRRPHSTKPPRSRTDLRTIWIDLDNTPHIPLFRPIIRELEARGYSILLTARDAYQVCEMAKSYDLHPIVVGRHYGKKMVRKLAGALYRAAQLFPIICRENPVLAVSHGSRSQVILSRILGIPSVTIMDYEHSKTVPLARPSWMIVPSYYPEHVTGVNPECVRRYTGIKEDVYVPEFAPDERIQQQLGLPSSNVIVSVRPPASEAHYHNPEADVLFAAFMERICLSPDVTAVLLPRNQRQAEQIRSAHPEWFKDGRIIVPDGIVDGLNLLWHSDLVVSGGGTMNREAAALGIPVYSIFRGKSAAVDRRLQEEGRLILIENVDQVHEKIRLCRRPKASTAEITPRPALSQIVGYVEEILTSN